MKTIRLLAIIEASSLTGPAKNLIEFCVRARELNAPRIETHLVTFRRADSGGSDAFLEAVRAACIPVEIISESGPLDFKTMGSLRGIVARVKPDILQTHAVKSHFLMRSSGLWKERPWVAFHHGYTLVDTKMVAYNLLDLWSLRAPVRILAVSGAFRRQLTSRGIGSDRVTVLHNAVNADWVEQSGFSRESARDFLDICQSDQVILAVGRLSREKAFGDLVNAIAVMRTAHPELHPLLYIAGEGPERLRLERRISSLRLHGTVTLTGAIRQLAPYYAASDLLAISSIGEGSPNALLEAMAAGLPVVSTGVGGIPEIVEHEKSAMLVQSGNPKALAQALAQMLSQPDLAHRMAGRARAEVIDRFNPQTRAGALAKIYAEVLAGA